MADQNDVLLIPRQRLQELLEDAVSHGKLSRDTAAELVAELVRRGLPAPAAPPPLCPIPGYDELTAAQVRDRLTGLAPMQLRQLRDYERRNANRKSVLAAVEAELA